MKIEFQKLNKWVKKILISIFILGTVIVLSLLYPTRAQFSYQYPQGTKWKYNDLKSDFNFPIVRSADEIKAEKDKIRNEYIPRFKKNNQAFQNAISYIDNLAMDSVDFNKASEFKDFLKKEISGFYKKGIVSDVDIAKIKSTGIILDDGKKTVKKELEDVLTQKKVKEILLNKTNNKFPALLSKIINLEVTPNYSYDSDINKKLLKELTDKVSTNAGFFKKGDIIISKNEVVTAEKYKTLNSYKDAFTKELGKNNNYYYLQAGYFILSLLILAILLYFLYREEPQIFNQPRRFLFLLLWIVAFAYLVFLVDNKGETFVYAIPFAIVPIIVLNFFKKYLALYLHIVIILIASLITKLGYEFTVLQLIVGMVTILTFSELRFWNKFFRGILIIFLTYIIGYISLSFINAGTVADINWKVLVSFFINALLILLAYPLIPLIEKPFGFISKITISELGDLNKPLLKELSLKAPGTLQHSLQVANLCEAAAEKIGANSLLIKVGAMYHDIGKTYAPEFFIENQRKGENPYENLDYFESAEHIIKHVTLGEKIAIKNGLPKILQRFIITHHGTTRVEYFYRKQVNDFPDKEFDETLFRYPGPKPKTKEESIMMIADSIEAATKSLNKPSSQDINDLVESISKYKIDEGQLEESELTFEELEKIKEVFKTMLKNIHHIRIEYPKLNK